MMPLPVGACGSVGEFFLARQGARSQLERRFSTGEISMRFGVTAVLAAIAVGAALPAFAQQVGEVGVDWLGNDIIIEAVPDPKVQGVTCHVSYFERGMVDRLQKGNWFEDPSDSSISCRQTGPITIGDISMGEDGEEIFNQGISLIWKQQVVNRIYDKANDTLVYLSHSRQVQDGSAKMSLTTVPLYGQEVVWTNGKPQ
jgi:CreA protein